MIGLGDEVITCALGRLKPDSHGQHRHSDECFEVRFVFDKDEPANTITISDLLTVSAKVCPCVCTPAPLPLLRRKTQAYYRLVKILRRWEHWDQGSAHNLLDRVLIEVDRYLFADEASSRAQGDPDPDAGTQAERNAFDNAVAFALEYRRDHGRGRCVPHRLLSHLITALNVALPVDAQVVCPF